LAGGSPRQAIDESLGRLQQAANCIVRVIHPVATLPDLEGKGNRPGTVTFGRSKNRILGESVSLRSESGGKSGLRFSLSQDFRVSHQPDDPPAVSFRVTTAAYRYAITDEQDRELFTGTGNRKAGAAALPICTSSMVGV